MVAKATLIQKKAKKAKDDQSAVEIADEKVDDSKVDDPETVQQNATSKVETLEVDWNVPWRATREQPGFPLLDSAKHYVVHAPSLESGVYHHHPQIAKHKKTMFAIWSNHPLGEDGSGQRVLGAMSKDGSEWKSLGVVFDSLDETKESSVETGRIIVASHFIVARGRLFAIGVVQDITGFGPAKRPRSESPTSQTKTEECPTKMRKHLGFLARQINPDGEMGPECWLGENRLKSLPNQRKIKLNTIPKPIREEVNGSLAEEVTASAWDLSKENEWIAEDGRMLCEPAAAMLDGRHAIRYFRDRENSQKLYMQIRSGSKWTKPKQTNIPDAPSKIAFGKIKSDGRYFLIGNQVISERGTRRDPLTIGLSDDAFRFS